MQRSREPFVNSLTDLLQLFIVVAGPFVLACILIITGGALCVWVKAPRSVAMRRVLAAQWRMMDPQPARVPLGETNIMVVSVATLSDAAAWISPKVTTDAAVWVNGKAFQSGGAAAWELVRSAWRFYLLGAGTALAYACVRRRRRPRGAPREQR